MSETIECAAILRQGKVWSVPRPGRHHDVLMLMFSTGIEESHGDTQGFVTSAGRFVKRGLAVRIAKKAGQITEPKFQPHALFSEDLW